MRNSLFLTPLLLAACATVPAGPPPANGVTPGRTCQPGGTAQFIGQPATSESGAAILRATGAGVIRWAPPGMMMTMDFRSDRVTVRLDGANRITDINCG